MPGAAAALPEAIRLVIWDLDDTFWDGTLSEAGIAWREDRAEIVRTLSRRGIVNSICSKNDVEPVRDELRRHGLDDHFVFASVSWEPKGPRLRHLVEAVQLRPQTILFIDDNPGNRAEAAHFVPGLQVADETAIDHLLDDPKLAGKPDEAMARLAQYRVLERRQTDLRGASGDTAAFLRESRITVEIDHDFAGHEDRAIELINRTNQLNFTKRRLPEDPGAAREELRALLARHTIQAGILRVRDRYGDYGFCGLYVQACDQSNDRPYLLHFAFSCRILGMGVETWLYRELGRPILHVRGEVLTDIAGDAREIDWVARRLPGDAGEGTSGPRKFAYVLARGGCDMRALSHYFAAVSGRIVDEAAAVRHGAVMQTSSTLLAVHAIDGAPRGLVQDAAPLGYLPEDFASLVASPPAGPGLWLLNLFFEMPIPVLRHRATGALIPASRPGAVGQDLQNLAQPDGGGIDPALLAHVRRCFEFVGPLPDDIFCGALRRILSRAPQDARVFIVLANEQGRKPDGTPRVLEPMRHRNVLTAQVASEFPAVDLLAPARFMSAEALANLPTPHHYDRLVYFTMFKHIMARCSTPSPAP